MLRSDRASPSLPRSENRGASAADSTEISGRTPSTADRSIFSATEGGSGGGAATPASVTCATPVSGTGAAGGSPPPNVPVGEGGVSSGAAPSSGVPVAAPLSAPGTGLGGGGVAPSAGASPGAEAPWGAVPPAPESASLPAGALVAAVVSGNSTRYQSSSPAWPRNAVTVWPRGSAIASTALSLG